MRRLLPIGFGTGLAIACTPNTTPPTAQTTPAPSASVAVGLLPAPEVIDAGPPKAPAPLSKCKPLGPNEISDDDHPPIAGVDPDADTVAAVEWLEKREVSKKAAVGWYASRMGMKTEDADLRISEMACSPAKLGDPAEEAILCTTYEIAELMPQRLLGIVVRKKQPFAVFQVGLSMRSMDFPDAHHLDLAFRLGPDGKSFDLFDRAPDGTQLVLSPKACLAAEKNGHRPMIAPAMLGYPATLHDCEGAKKLMAEMGTSTPTPQWRSVVASGRSFVTRSCNERGRWVWNKDRFSLDPTSVPKK